MKTADDLKITADEYQALLKVRNKLANKDIRRKQFNMGTTCTRYDCGTVACVGGWMGIELGVGDVSEFVYKKRYTSALGALFFPDAEVVWTAIKPKHAVKAIDNVLKTGEPEWEKVMNGLI